MNRREQIAAIVKVGSQVVVFLRAYVHLATLPPDDELWAEMDDAALQLAERLGQGDTEFLTSRG